MRAINKWAGASKKRAAEAEKNHKNKANERRLVSRWCTTRATASPTTRPLTVARRPPPSFLQAASGCLFPLAARPMGVATRVGQGGGSLGQPPYAHFTQAERVYFFFFCAVRVYQVFTAFPFPGDTTRFHRISWPHSVWRVLWAWATLDKYGTWSIWNSLLTGQAKASAKDTLQLFRFFWTSLGSIGALALHISLKPSEIIICLYGNRIFCFSSPFDVTGFHKIVLLWIRFEWVK